MDAADLRRDLPLLYEELQNLAEHMMRGERPDHALQASDLVHEAYLRLRSSPSLALHDRTHLRRLAARTMRRVLVDHARAKLAHKRGDGKPEVPLTEVRTPERDAFDAIEVHEALERLAERDPVAADVAELKLFGRCTNDDIAASVGVSSRTVNNKWAVALGWLGRALEVS